VILPLFFDIASTLAASDRTEVRARYVDPDAVVDIETDPKITYRGAIRGGRGALTVSYGPRVVFTNFAGSSAPVNGQESDAQKVDLLHQGNLLLEWQLQPRTRFVLNAGVQYGTVSVGTLLVQPRWDGEDRPQVARPFSPNARARFDLLSLNLESGIVHFVTPRLSVQPSVFLFTYGGPTFESQKRLPYLLNPGVKLSVAYALRPTDDLALEIAPQVNRFSATTPELNAQLQPLREDGQPIADAADVPRFVSRSVASTYQVFAEARYRHRFSPVTHVEAAAGVNATFQEQSGNTQDPFNFSQAPTTLKTQNFPIAEVLVNAGLKTGFARTRLIAFVRLAPWFNQLIGENQLRLENVVAASFSRAKHAVRAGANVLQSAPGEDLRFRQITAEFAYEYRVTASWAVDAGLRVGQQSVQLPDFQKARPFDEPRDVSTFQPGGFLGVSYRPEGRKL
jgi:hypothetical protein